MKRHRKAGFSLVEILTGLVIFATISACSWVAVSTLFRGETLSSNRTTAINLLQKSQEELRRASLSFYRDPGLDKCQFPAPGITGTCNLQALGPQFNGFTRSAVITPEHGGEIMRAVVTVDWTDEGKAKSMNSAVMITKPPDTMPGNLSGKVTSTATGSPLIQGVSVRVTHNKSKKVYQYSTQDHLINSKDVNYDFASPTGAYQLEAGDYTLEVIPPENFKPYTGITALSIGSRKELTYNFTLDPKPEGTINVTLIDAQKWVNQGVREVLPSFNNAYIQILDDYRRTGLYWQVYSQPTFTKKILFDDNKPKDFTIDTYYGFRAGYVGETFKKGAPSCTYEYHPIGWSSSVMLDDKYATFNCSNDWQQIDTDRFVVAPGQTLNVDIPLFEVPVVTVEGYVRDGGGKPLPGSVIYAHWPDGTWWTGKGYSTAYLTATADSTGHYSYQVPAVQEMYPNDLNGGALTLRAEHNMDYFGCCNQQQRSLQYGFQDVIGLFAAGSPYHVDITIPDPEVKCGNLAGNIRDGFTGTNITGAYATVQSQNAQTNVGDYIFQCPDQGYRLPYGLAVFQASKGEEYYFYDNRGTQQYAPGPYVNILVGPAQAPNYDAKLWPKGKGSVDVLVVQKGTTTPIPNVSVILKTYDGVQHPLTTDNEGKASYSDIIETWPPENLDPSSYYNHNAAGHNVQVTDPSGFYNPSETLPMPSLKKGDNPVFTVELTKHGGA